MHLLQASLLAALLATHSADAITTCQAFAYHGTAYHVTEGNRAFPMSCPVIIGAHTAAGLALGAIWTQRRTHPRLVTVLLAGALAPSLYAVQHNLGALRTLKGR